MIGVGLRIEMVFCSWLDDNKFVAFIKMRVAYIKHLNCAVVTVGSK